MALAFAASAFGRSLAVAFFIAQVEGGREEIPFNASTPDLSGEASHCDGSSHSELRSWKKSLPLNVLLQKSTKRHFSGSVLPLKQMGRVTLQGHTLRPTSAECFQKRSQQSATRMKISLKIAKQTANIHMHFSGYFFLLWGIELS